MATWHKFDVRDWVWLNQFFARLSEFPASGSTVTPPPPPPTEYIITSNIISRAPNAGTSYVYGYCRQPDGQGWDNKQVFYSWRGSSSPIGYAVSGKGEWSQGYFSIPVFPPDDGMWDFWCYDPVRQLTSPRLEVDVDQEQVEIMFQLTSASTTPPPPGETFREYAWRVAKAEQAARGISLNPNAAIQRQVLADNGIAQPYWVCITNEFDATWQGTSLVMQLFGRYNDSTERVYYWRKSDGALGMFEYP